MKSIILSAENAKQLGRTLLVKDTINLILSAEGVEFTFTGKKLNVSIGCDETAFNDGKRTNFPRIAVMADGKFKVKKVIENRKETFCIIDSQIPITKTIRIVKLSEGAFSIAELYPIETDDGAEIVPTPEKNLKIEFIGDSITCGYGVDDSNISSPFATEAENSTKSYAYLTADMLDADYSIFSYSGYGIISGYTSDEKRNTDEILPPWYESYGFSYSSVQGTKPQNIPWDFSRFRPDIIVLNLGTNDNSFCMLNKFAYQEFENGYLDFLRNIRKNNPNSKIVCVSGIMETDTFRYVKNAVERFSDGNTYTFLFRTQDGTLGYGSNWHPSEDTHLYSAEALSDFIRNL